MTDESNGRRRGVYSLAKLESVKPPQGGSQGEWYRYLIRNDSADIVGMRAGSMSDVRFYVEEYIERLNQRSKLGYSSYAPRKVSK